jgi:hypothetical protein
MGISEFDSTLENEPGTSASSDSKLPEAFCTFNVVESATTGTIGKRPFLQSKLRWFEKIATGNLSTLFHRYDLFAVNNPIPYTGYQLYR